MPGFAVAPENVNFNDNNPLAPSRADYYYTYTWYAPVIQGWGVSDAQSLIHLKEASLPTYTANVEKYIGGSVEYKFAKSVSWDDIKLSWYDTVGLLPVIREWRMRVWSPAYGLRSANEYKALTTLTCFLPNGDREYSYLLYGSWPSSIKHGDLTYSNSDVKSIDVTLTYDYAEEEEKSGGTVQ